MPAAVETVQLGKRFGRTTALDRVDAVVPEGRALALLGPNGAGKSTFLGLAATLLRPTSGSVRLFGVDAGGRGSGARHRIGLLSHQSFLYAELTPLENLRFYGRLYGVERAETRITEMVGRMRLAGWLHRPVRTLSRGAQQRCALARVLLHDPDLLFLDEPFTGLDIEAAQALEEVLREEHARGVTLVMTTHELARVARLCDSAIVLRSGRIVWQGSIDTDDPAELRASYEQWLTGERPGGD